MGPDEEDDDSRRTLEFEDSVSIRRSKNEVWAFISDPENLVECVPGAEDINKLSEREYTFEIAQSIARFTITLEGDVELVEMDEPDWILADGSAYDDSTGSTFDVITAMEMTESDEDIKLIYRAELTMTGGIASVGARLAKRVIRSNVEEYFDNVKSALHEEAN